MIRSRLLTALFCVLVAAGALTASSRPLRAACAPELWPARFNGATSQSDMVTHVVVGPADTVYVCGTSVAGSNGADVVVLRYANTGELLWQARYDGAFGTDTPVALKVDAAGNAYVAVNIGNDSIVTGGEMGVLKFDQNGAFLWAFRHRTFQGNTDYARDLEIDAEGNAYLLGLVEPGILNRFQDIFTAKLSPEGQAIWINIRALLHSRDNAYDLDLDAQGGVYVAGRQSNVQTNESSGVLLKYSQNSGALVWTCLLGNGAPTDLLLTENAIFLAAKVAIASPLLLRCSLAGALEWTKPIEQTPVTLAPADGGGVYLAGTTSLARYDSTGERLWIRFEAIHAFEAKANGDLCVAATAAGPDQIHDMARIARYDSEGNLLWEALYEGFPSKSMEVGALAHDQAGNVFLASGVWHSPTDPRDILTLKYDTQGRPVPALAAPGGLAGTAASISQIDLTWSDQSSGEAGFALERSTGGGAFTVLETLPPGTSVYSDFGLAQDATYTYRVRALGEPCPSRYSNEVSVRTLVLAPGPPSGLTATVPDDLSGHRSVRLAWAVSPYARRVRIERAAGVGEGLGFVQIASVEAPVDAYLDTGLTPGASYTYRARAENESGISGYSANVVGVTPALDGGKLVAPKNVKLPNTRVGRTTRKVIKITNQDRTKSLRVEPQGIAAPYGLINGAGAILIPPRGKVSVTLQFAPTAAGNWPSELRLRSDDAAKPEVSIVVIGKAKG